MFQKVLIANRGEIAVRIIRACKQMGIETVAIYSVADKDSLHVQIADDAVCVGGAKSNESYLNMENIVTAAISKGAEAIHPGFGFLSENSDFANLCQECGLRFIGPSGNVIDQMGNKSKAREIMIKAGVPVVPGSNGAVKSLDDARSIALEIGFPILIKASAGGGGRGMRVANIMDEFDNAFETAKSEAINAFGDGTMYLEKYVINTKHIEFQIMADKYGNVVHLGERDCSIQRRNQKVLEEAPSLISEDLRKRMGDAAILASKSVNYENAGTIEFLLSGDDFYFIEMNTRIQVEHPVTEMVTGIDIIKEQIKVSAGKELSFTQEDIVLKGHSIEVRINAEDPKHGFRPNPGKIDLLHVPSGNGIRFDSFIYTGYSIPPFYDSMMGKVIVHGENRIDAINKMKATLEELVIGGVTTNQDFCYMILNNADYVKGEFDTGFIGMKIDSLLEYDE
ncbi:MAG: Biotin carboxylase [Candidatus Izimaplasma bacterium HR2]|nr:MAG: Biotin carboxylase [Candidatus Izimaplasma bacterium HR2]